MTDNQKRETTETIRPPRARVVEFPRTAHGETWNDDYEWMEHDTSEVARHIDDENEYTDRSLEGQKPLEGKLARELNETSLEEDTSAEVRRDGYVYYYRTEKGKNHGIYCRRRDEPGAQEEILLDQNQLAEGHKHFKLSTQQLSRDQRYLAYTTDITGGENEVLYIKDLQTGELLPERVQGVKGSIAWSADGKYIFYTTVDEAGRTAKVMRHELGNQGSDDLVYEEKDTRYWVFVHGSRTWGYIFINSSHRERNEQMVIPADSPLEEPRVIVSRDENIKVEGIEHRGDSFIISTDDSAPDNRLISVSTKGGGRDTWKTIVNNVEGGTIVDYTVFKDHMLVVRRVNGFTRLFVYNFADINNPHEMQFPSERYTVMIGGNPQFETNVARIIYTSSTEPHIDYDLDMTSFSLKKIKEEEIPSGYNPEDFRSSIVYATAEDGTQIPITMTHSKDVVPGRTPAPLILYAYGADQISIDPQFNATNLPLLRRGVIMAVAHIRGGGELGRKWYEDGKYGKKENTFSDYIRCAEHLIRTGVSKPDQMIARGGSAGGMLMGVVANRAPHLFKAIIAHVPLVDTLRTMLDNGQPIASSYRDEIGDPENDRESFDAIRAYSPMDNVTSQEYPNILVIHGSKDGRVPKFHSLKWVAKLRAKKTGGSTVHLKMRPEGHQGPSGRKPRHEAQAFEHAYILDQFGITE